MCQMHTPMARKLIHRSYTYEQRMVAHGYWQSKQQTANFLIAPCQPHSFVGLEILFMNGIVIIVCGFRHRLMKNSSDSFARPIF